MLDGSAFDSEFLLNRLHRESLAPPFVPVGSGRLVAYLSLLPPQFFVGTNSL